MLWNRAITQRSRSLALSRSHRPPNDSALRLVRTPVKIYSFPTGLLLLAAATTQPSPPGRSYAIWALLFLGIAIVLFLLEVIVPSGGVIGLLSALCTVVGVVMLFQVDTILGLIGAIVALAVIPFLFLLALKMWPHTPIGQMLTLKHPPPVDDQTNDRDAPQPVELVGAQGKALTDLHPIGTCMINGHRTECLATTGLIRSGSPVRVVSVTGLEIKVRPVSET